jgi:hypothetical protein
MSPAPIVLGQDPPLPGISGFTGFLLLQENLATTGVDLSGFARVSDTGLKLCQTWVSRLAGF